MLTLHSTPESHGKDVFARMQRARERRSYNRTKVRDVSPARVTLWDGRDVAEQQRYKSHVQKMFFSDKISLLRNLSGANFCSVQARSTRDHLPVAFTTICPTYRVYLPMSLTQDSVKIPRLRGGE